MLIRPLPFLLVLLMAPPAVAASLSTMLSGSALTMDTPCARHVEIVPDPTLKGQVAVQATAEHQEELDHLMLETRNEAAVIHTRPGQCWRAGFGFGSEPTLVLSVRVAAGMALSVDESAVATYAIGPVGGRLSVDISGSTQINAARASRLDVNLSGNGAVTVDQAGGPVNVDLSGHGKVSIGQVTGPRLSVDISGAGALSVAGGQIDSVSIDDSGAGSIQIGAAVGDATVDLSGVGSVHFAKVAGRVEKDVSGMGSVTIGE
jgi:hypothetical protein